MLHSLGLDICPICLKFTHNPDWWRGADICCHCDRKSKAYKDKIMDIKQRNAISFEEFRKQNMPALSRQGKIQWAWDSFWLRVITRFQVFTWKHFGIDWTKKDD